MNNLKKFRRDYKLPRIEFVKFQLDQTINHTQKILNDTEITILSYIYCYGMDANDKIYKDRILTNMNSVINYVSKLTRAGYLIKEPALESTTVGKKGYSNIYLHPNLKITDEDFIQVSVVTLDHESDEVFHPHFRK